MTIKSKIENRFHELANKVAPVVQAELIRLVKLIAAEHPIEKVLFGMGVWSFVGPDVIVTDEDGDDESVDINVFIGDYGQYDSEVSDEMAAFNDLATWQEDHAYLVGKDIVL